MHVTSPMLKMNNLHSIGELKVLNKCGKFSTVMKCKAIIGHHYSCIKVTFRCTLQVICNFAVVEVNQILFGM